MKRLARARDILFPTYGRISVNQPQQLFEKWPLTEQLPNQETLTHQAQRCLEHKFSFLGQSDLDGSVLTGKPTINFANRSQSTDILSRIAPNYRYIDWQRDFRSGYRWPSDCTSIDIRFGHNPGADIRFAWEVARFHHLLWFAVRFWQTGDEVWWLETQNQVLDFLAHNPPRFGIHWVCSMELGIRLTNWIVSYELFRVAGAEAGTEFRGLLLGAVRAHANHILTHLEWHPSLRTNHFLANVCGVAFASAFLPEDKETRIWRDWAKEQLEMAVDEQFSHLGANLEGSTSYHRLAAEMVLYTAAVLRGLGCQFRLGFFQKIWSMLEFTQDVTKPDGRVYQLVDNDSGRFLKIVPTICCLDHRHLVGAATGLFESEGLEDFAGDWSGLGGLVRGLAREKWPVSNFTKAGPLEFGKPTRPPSTSSCWTWSLRDTGPLTQRCYPEFGLYLFRGETTFLALRCGDVGQMGRGGHAHCDQLSVELYIGDETILTEAGTFCYTGDLLTRNLYRSTGAHNGPHPKGWEQAGLHTDAFRLSDVSISELVYFGADGCEARLRCRGGWLHRQVRFVGDFLHIHDWHTDGEPIIGIREIMTKEHDSEALCLSPGYGQKNRDVMVRCGLLTTAEKTSRQ